MVPLPRAVPGCLLLLHEAAIPHMASTAAANTMGMLFFRRFKLGQYGRFYGCSNYPKCDFVSWYKPIEGEVCPECGAAYVVEKKRSGKVCQICGHKIED